MRERDGDRSMRAIGHMTMPVAGLLVSFALLACGGSASSSSVSSTTPTAAKTQSSARQLAPQATTGPSALATAAAKAAAEAESKAASKGSSVGGAHKSSIRQSLERFSSCMRKNGIDYPKPKISGTVRILEASHLDRSSPQFKAAQAKCAQLAVR